MATDSAISMVLKPAAHQSELLDLSSRTTMPEASKITYKVVARNRGTLT